MKFLKNLIKDIKIFGLENVFGRFYSRYPAEVIENVDIALEQNIPEDSDVNPDGQRLLLHIPAIHEEGAAEWVESGNIIAGNNYGFQSIPRKGDYVYVTFGYGDTNHPRWHYGWYGENERPELFKENKDLHGFISPGQQKVYFDDLNQKTVIEQPNGSLVEMSEDDITITFGNGQTVKIDSTKVYIAEGGTQPIALGNETVDAINQLNAQVQALNAALITFTSAQNAVALGTPLFSPLAPAWTALATAITPINANLTGAVTTQTQLIPSKNSETK